jgi:hypothetical protein
VNAGTTLEGQLWILHMQIAAELEAAQGAPNVVCDRSVVDNYCYLVNRFGRQRELEGWLLWWMKTYDLLAGIPPFGEPIIRDGFRSEDRDFQGRIDELLKELLHEPPFDALVERVIWMDGTDRGQWAQRIFAAAFPAAGPSEGAQERID